MRRYRVDWSDDLRYVCMNIAFLIRYLMIFSLWYGLHRAELVLLAVHTGHGCAHH
jgi:hypothetical protein